MWKCDYSQMSRSPWENAKTGLNGTLMYTLSSGKISAVWYSGTLSSKNKRLFSIRHCTITITLRLLGNGRSLQLSSNFNYWRSMCYIWSSLLFKCWGFFLYIWFDFPDVGFSTRKQNTGEVILQIPPSLCKASHYKVTNTDKKKPTNHIASIG